MRTEPDSFDELKRLLILKRHEQPPPDYFDGFSGAVLERIQTIANEPASGWRYWLAWFELKPLLAGAYGLAVCGLLLFGIGLAQLMQAEPLIGASALAWQELQSTMIVTSAWRLSENPRPSLGRWELPASSFHPVLSQPPASFLPPGGGLRVQAVHYQVGGN